MKQLMPNLDKKKGALYQQLYEYIRSEILKGNLQQGERLPSLRTLSRELKISVTTISQAYDQLAVEGYVTARTSSGYYISDIGTIATESIDMTSEQLLEASDEKAPLYDLSCFDFNKWKKCANRVYTEHSHLLLYEGDPQGEYPLRHEIAEYVFNSRGVKCTPQQIVIGAGTQQITTQLTRILKAMEIGHVAVENPGYLPVRNTFEDRGFAITSVPVGTDGIVIEKLPINISCAAYVNPSNQFPTGAVMPVGRRRKLLEWAQENDSYIIEDDYDSELRYFGRPVPAMQGMDSYGRVVYLGSFSSTLFPAIKISYMILPLDMCPFFNAIKGNYTQTCSKAEQLTLSLFMKEGLYQTNIRKLRNLYSQKQQRLLSAIEIHAKGRISVSNTSSGINMILRCQDRDALLEKGRSMGLNMQPLRTGEHSIIFYYNQIPLEDIEQVIEKLTA